MTPFHWKPWAAYLLAVALYALLFSVWQIEPVPDTVHLFSIVLVALCALPITIWTAQGMKGVPAFELICLSVALQYATPVYLALSQIIIFSEPVLLTWELVFQALAFAIVGTAAMIGGFYLSRTALRHGPVARLDLPLDVNKFVYCVAAAALIGIITLAVQSQGLASATTELSAVLRLLANQLNIAIALLAYRAFSERGNAELRHLIFLFSLVLVAVVFGLATGFLESALIPAALVMVVWWHSTRRLPIVLLIACFALFIVFNGAKQQYRLQVWNADSPSGLPDRITPWFDITGTIVNTLVNGDLLNDSNTTIQKSMARLDLLHKFAYVTALTPTPLPYLDGETYSYFAVTWIPRFLWPDKPEASVALNRVDFYYRLRDEGNTSTIAIGQLAEAYANFGVYGIIIVMALQGVVFGALDHVLNGPDSQGGRAIYLTLMLVFLNGIGSLSVILFGNLLQSMIVSAVFLRPFALGFSSRSATPQAKPAPDSLGPKAVVSNVRSDRKIDVRL